MFKVDGKKQTEKERMKTEKIIAKLVSLKMLGKGGQWQRSQKGSKAQVEELEREVETTSSITWEKKRIRSLFNTYKFMNLIKKIISHGYLFFFLCEIGNKVLC